MIAFRAAHLGISLALNDEMLRRPGFEILQYVTAHPVILDYPFMLKRTLAGLKLRLGHNDNDRVVRNQAGDSRQNIPQTDKRNVSQDQINCSGGSEAPDIGFFMQFD